MFGIGVIRKMLGFDLRSREQARQSMSRVVNDHAAKLDRIVAANRRAGGEFVGEAAIRGDEAKGAKDRAQVLTETLRGLLEMRDR